MKAGCLLGSTCLLFLSVGESFNLLLIGDSFDRFFVDEWCKDNQSKDQHRAESNSTLSHGIFWGHKNLMMDVNRRPFFCRDSLFNDTVATFSIYGSNLKHPYMQNHTNEYDDTDNRIKLGMRSYFDLIDSAPDRIIITATQWDALYLSFEEPYASCNGARLKAFLLQKSIDHNLLLDFLFDTIKQETKRKCNMRINARLNDTHCDHQVDIGLRSTTRNNGNICPELLRDFNSQVHGITIQRNLTWYDMEADIWSYSDFHDDSQLFRDWLHIVPSLSAPIVNKLLNRQYTQFLEHHNEPLSHIISNAQQLKHKQYENVNFQLIRGKAANTLRVDHKNNQIQPIVNVTHNTLPPNHIPGFGPIYYSLIVNNTRVKWFIGEESFSYHSLFYSNTTEQPHNNYHRFKNSTHTHLLHSINTKYEHKMRVILRCLFLTVSDLVLLSDELMQSIPTQGIMPVLINNTFPVAFTVINSTNINGFDLYLTKPLENIPRFIPHLMVDSVLTLIQKNENITLHKLVDPFWLLQVMQPVVVDNIPNNLFHNDRLLRYHRDPSVQCVLNLTRHYFSGLDSFVKRGFDFSNVLKYDSKLAFYIDLMPAGESLT